MAAKSSGVTATERMLAEFCGGWPGNRRGGGKRAGGRSYDDLWEYIVFFTSVRQGFSLHDELRSLNKAGLSPAQRLARRHRRARRADETAGRPDRTWPSRRYGAPARQPAGRYRQYPIHRGRDRQRPLLRSLPARYDPGQSGRSKRGKSHRRFIRISNPMIQVVPYRPEWATALRYRSGPDSSCARSSGAPCSPHWQHCGPTHQGQASHRHPARSRLAEGVGPGYAVARSPGLRGNGRIRDSGPALLSPG